MELFKILGRIAIDGQEEAKKGLDSVSDKAGKVSKAFLNGIGTVAKWGAAATVAAAGVATALVKSAVSSYAEYEQLVGGVETLFKDSASTVQKYAAQAYQTAGLSANQYMETVTGFSASLLQSLGGDTEAAAEKANTAIIDMSDNANKMGTDMASIQNAYQGFAKQNYTMLDNLKLGYGGTKEEMERLLVDAEKLSGFKYDISSYADIVDAIHVVQTEMGITGTTAKEASETISGSLGMTKSAWQNLVTGMADDTQNFDVLINQFVESASTAWSNLEPRIEIALQGVKKLIEKLMPTIFEAIPKLVKEFLPTVITAGLGILNALVKGIVEGLPILLESTNEIINQFIDAIVTLLPVIVEAALEIALALVEGLVNNADKILSAAGEIIITLINGLKKALPKLISYVPSLVTSIASTITKYLPQILQAGISLLLELAKGILQALPDLLEQLPEIITSICESLLSMTDQIIEAGVELLTALVDNLPLIISTIVRVLPQIIQNIVKTLINNVPKIVDAGVKLLTSLIQNLPLIITTIVDALPQIIAGILEVFTDPDTLVKIAQTGFDLLVSLITKLPEILMEILVGVGGMIGSVITGIKNTAGSFVDAGKKLFNEFWNGLKAKWASIEAWVKEKARWIADTLGMTAINDTASKLASSASSRNYIAETQKAKKAKASVRAVGGVVQKGEIAVLEGSGAEAVVPLDQNQKWISAVARDMNNELSSGIGNRQMLDVMQNLQDAIYNLPEALSEAMLNMKLDFDKREVARMVRSVNA